MQIPATGLSKEQILGTLQAYKSRDMDWESGKVWCYVYDPGDETTQLVREAYQMYLTENGLDPTAARSGEDD